MSVLDMQNIREETQLILIETIRDLAPLKKSLKSLERPKFPRILSNWDHAKKSQ